VERRRLNGPFEIVIIEPAARSERVLASSHEVRFVTPTWKRDGNAVIAAVARDGEPFNLFEFPVPPPGSSTVLTGRQLTFTAAGATWPELSPDGRTIVFVGYTSEGFDLFAVPYPDSPPESRFPTPGSRTPTPESRVPAVSTPPYAPWKTLAPTSWSPVIDTGNSQFRAGFAVGGYDVLGYHAYAAAVTWLIDAPSDVIRPSRSDPDWAVAYAYDRWRPTFFASASSDTSFFAGAPADDGTPSSNTVRQREFGAGVLFPFRRVRRSTTLSASLVRARDSYSGVDGGRIATRAAARAASTFTSAHSFGFSISPERGVSAGATLELVRRQLGSDANAAVATADFRAYLPGVGRSHVLAMRGAAGVSAGDRDMGRTFLLGGAAAGELADFSSDAVRLLRTFPTASFAGRRAAAINLDYRWPLSRPQRGIGTWPVFLHTIHAAVFADAGHAWTRSFDAAHLKASAGVELSADTVWGYTLPLTLTVGVGWGRDGADRFPSGTAAYLRVGRAF
jgi:hypothetical protein